MTRPHQNPAQGKLFEGPSVAAFSGGKDSTAMVYAMAEDDEDFRCLFTPTGNEPPGVMEHVQRVCEDIDHPLVMPHAPTLVELIEFFSALPNWRQRWCTRMIKIEPCIAYLLQHPCSTLCVGLRADEEDRQGLYGECATYRYPLRDRGWGLADVIGYLNARGITVPIRTDCCWCYDQRLSDWYWLWTTHPNIFQRGVELEERYGHAFRSPARDTWPASLGELREQFVADRIPAERKANFERCRVCQA